MESVNSIMREKWILRLEKSIEYLTYLMILLFYTGKVFQVFTVLIDILFLALLYLKHDRHFIEEHKKLIGLWGLFFLYLFFQSLFANHVSVALVNSIGMIRFVVLMFALIYVFNTNVKIKRLLYSIIAIVFALFVDSVIQYFSGKDLFGFPLFGGYRLTAWNDTAKLASYVSVFSGAVMGSILIFKNKWIGWSALLMLLLMTFFSGSKGPLLYLSASIVLVLIFSSKFRKYLLLAFFALGLLLAIAIGTNDTIASRFSQFKHPLSSQNTSSRNQIYATAVEILKEHPLLGIGGKNFRYEFNKYYPKVYESKKNKTYSDRKYLTVTPLHVHSMLLSYFLNWGIVGFLLFVYILWYIFKKFVRGNEIAILSTVGFLYCIAPFNFGNTIARSPWQFFVFLTLSLVIVLSQYKKVDKKI